TASTTAVLPITSSTTVVWTYSDGTNSTTQNQSIVIADTTAPVINCIGNQTLACGETLPDYRGLISASDNCDTSFVIEQIPAIGSSIKTNTLVTIRVIDKSGNSSKCDFVVDTRLVTVDAGSDVSINEGGNIQLNAIASSTGSFKWNPATGLSNLLIPNPIVNPLVTTTYTVVYTSTDGCVAEDSVTVFVEKIKEDETKYGFSPNDDGINDFWRIDTIEEYPNNEVYIYNRWGDLVFYTKKYDNSTNVFKGIANERRSLGADVLPEGTYFFEIKIEGVHHLKKTKGFLVLKR
ncbi:gliding motility-associated C-terminal domain-containing protein, partial [Flavobacterium polysaccharolyticum]